MVFPHINVEHLNLKKYINKESTNYGAQNTTKLK